MPVSPFKFSPSKIEGEKGKDVYNIGKRIIGREGEILGEGKPKGRQRIPVCLSLPQ